ncbi:hypothetical protein ACX9I7_00660 [Streptomyces sp. L500]
MSGQPDETVGACDFGRAWTAMNHADFDLAAPNELNVPAAARITAVPDRFGTAPLFGEEPPPPRPARPPRTAGGGTEGQDALF